MNLEFLNDGPTLIALAVIAYIFSGRASKRELDQQTATERDRNLIAREARAVDAIEAASKSVVAMSDAICRQARVDKDI